MKLYAASFSSEPAPYALLPEIEEAEGASGTFRATQADFAHELEEELARYKARQAATVDTESGTKRRRASAAEAKKWYAEEEALRERANRQASIRLEKSESEARERAYYASQGIKQAKCTNWLRSAFQYHSWSRPEGADNMNALE